jgi:hypothetical protein
VGIQVNEKKRKRKGKEKEKEKEKERGSVLGEGGQSGGGG